MVFGDTSRASLVAHPNHSQGSWWMRSIAQKENRTRHMGALASARYTGQGDELLQGGAALVVSLVQLHSTRKHGTQKLRRAALLDCQNQKGTVAAHLQRDKKYFEYGFIGSTAATRRKNSCRVDICSQTLLSPIEKTHPEIASCCSLLVWKCKAKAWITDAAHLGIWDCATGSNTSSGFSAATLRKFATHSGVRSTASSS